MPTKITRRELTRSFLSTRATPSIVDIGVHKRILNRATFGPTAQDLIDIGTQGYGVWLERQLDWRGVDDSALETALAAASNVGSQSHFIGSWLARCVFSKRQLQYRTVAFWENHFNTDIAKTDPLVEIPENTSFRKAAFESFETLLRISAHSPAMLGYLDNNLNIAQQPNENYARELLELHTVGVNGGYVEADVAEVARVMTGWSYRIVVQPNNVNYVKFRFRPGQHDSGPKTVMGWSTVGYSGAQGVNEGESLLHYLATHSSTATRIATKLCTYFVHDAPSAQIVQNTAIMIKAGKPIGGAVRMIFDYLAGDNVVARDKTQDPQEFIFSTLRRLEVQWPTNLNAVNYWIASMGQPVFNFHVPTGYAETGQAWQKPGTQMARWHFIHSLTTDSIANMSVDWWSLAGNPTTAGELLDNIIARLVDRDVDVVTYNELLAWTNARIAAFSAPPTTTQLRSTIRDLAGLILRLPAAGCN